MNQVCIHAYGKINLGLDVIGRLENGYHEVKMVMQTGNIYDTLTIKRTPKEIKVTTSEGTLPTDENNLIYKVAKLMIETYQITEGVSIHLEKTIPIAAGMAGGSADAAATFHGMNELFQLKLSIQELQKLGVTIGADVPYCIMGGTALAEGIGEVLTELPNIPSAYLVIGKPDINVSTKYVYEQIDTIGVKKHPDVQGIVKAIENHDMNGIVSRLGNVLEDVTIAKYPIVESIKGMLIEEGAEGSLMSGSGPTVFGIFKEKEQAQKAFERIEKEQVTKQLFVTEFYQRS